MHIHSLPAVIAFTLLTACVGQAAGPPPASPFDTGRPTAAAEQPTGRFTCKKPPKPVRDLLFGGFYADKGSSIVDKEAMKRQTEARKPITRFENAIINMSDQYLRSPDERVARCVLDWMHAWAAADAMMGRVSSQGGFVRKWGLAPISASYIKIRAASTLDAEKRKTVLAWIRRWAKVVQNDYSFDTHRGSRRNNHLYWAAWSLTAASVALDDGGHWEWALDRYRFAVRQIKNDGTLPLEMARKSKALHYHLYSVAPLVLIAETAARNGIDLYGERDGALHRLIRRTLEGLDDPSFFERESGHSQNWVGTSVNGNKLAWLVPYHHRFPGPATEKWLARFDKFRDRRLGGDLKLLFPQP
jgi:poly(beta-D-mannuronate) lyase